MNPTGIVFAVVSWCAVSVFGGSAFGQAVGAGSESAAAQATTDVGGTTIYAGLRLWANQWDIGGVQRRAIIPDPSKPSLIVLQDTPFKTLSDTKLVPIPFIAVRAGNFVGSASYFPRTSYNSNDELLGTVARDEYDVTLGYAVAPSLILSIGYKHGFQSKVSGQFSPSGVNVDALLLGVSGSAPIVGTLSLYGNIAYGFARDRYDFGDTSGNRNYNGNYQIGEVGVLWRIYESSEGRALKNVSLSFGYRAQNLTTKGVPSATFALTPTPVVIDVQHKDLSTTTDGFVVGIVGSF